MYATNLALALWHMLNGADATQEARKALAEYNNGLIDAYHHHRRESNAAFKRRDGAASTGHALAADQALNAYATANGMRPDDAAAHMRKGAGAYDKFS